MVEAMRAMMDELLGKERNVPIGQRSGSQLRFDDDDVCKYDLCGLCPYSLFKNTKSNLGTCNYRIHRDHVEFAKVQEQWQKLPSREKRRYAYRRDLQVLLEGLVGQMDKKIQRQKERVAKECAPRELSEQEKAWLEKQKNEYKELLNKSATKAEEGDIDGSAELAQQAERIRNKYEQQAKMWTTPERSMTVCEVCGVFINATDNPQRREDHLTGKQYIGWKSIREKLAELQEEEASAGKQDAEEEYPDYPRRERDRDRERDYYDGYGDRQRDRDRSRSRDRDRYRDYGQRQRRSRERSRSYEREREYYRGSRDRYDSRGYDRRRGAEIAPPRDYTSSRRDRYYDEHYYSSRRY